MCCVVKKVFKWIIRIICLCLIAAAVAGAITVFKKQKDADWSKLAKSAPAFALLLVVMALAVVSGLLGIFLACCCDCCLILYIIILIICIIFEIVVIALSSKLKEKSLTLLHDSWGNPDFHDAKIVYEQNFQCCGYKEFESQLGSCGYKEADSNTPKCDKFISDDIEKSYKDLLIVTVIVLIVQVILFVLSIIVACCCKKAKVAASESTEDL